MFDDEIPASWCLGATFRCTVAESVGLWSAVAFYTTLIVVTLIHSVIQGQRGTAERNEEATRRHARKSDGDDLGFQLCLLVVYFFSFRRRQPRHGPSAESLRSTHSSAGGSS